MTTPAAFIQVLHASPDRWPEGVDVVLAAQAASGLPPVEAWPPAQLEVHTRERQARARSVFLAVVDDVVVGHALILPIDREHPEWGAVDDVAVSTALAAGQLVEFGALAVHPAWRQRGVAAALVGARLHWVARHHGFLGVANVWVSSPGSQTLARTNGRMVKARSGQDRCDRFAYDRPPAPAQ